MLQSTSYSDVKEYFERNCQYGYLHIRAWILSPKFHELYIKDTNRSLGAVIQIAPLETFIAEIDGTNHTVKGYKTIVSDGFLEDYGVCYIADSGLHEAAIELLKHNVSKDYDLK